MDKHLLPRGSRVGYVRLRVADLARAEAFYTGILGFRETGRDRATVFLSCPGASGWQVALAERKGAARRPRATAGLYHVAVLLPGRGALARALGRIVASRWTLAGASDHGVSEALYLSDPDGNGIELYADRPREAWPLRGGSVEMGSDALDLGDLLSAAGDAEDGGRLPVGTALGHVHLQVADLARSEAFYAGLLGLSVTQRTLAGALFLAAGRYHHHLGVNVWAGRGLPPAPEEAAGLLSFSFAVPGEGAIAAVAGRFREAGVPVVPPAAPAPPGAILVRDPDGIAVELVPAGS